MRAGGAITVVLCLGAAITGCNERKTATAGCSPARIATAAAPEWTRQGGVPTPPFPHAIASGERLAAYFFVTPLRVKLPKNAANKILWVTGDGAPSEPLTIEARSGGASVRVKAIAGGGHVYRSRTRFPRPGCWRFTGRWGTREATLDAAVSP